MTREEADLVITEQNENTEEILKVIEKEKCELLGIIQGKDKTIKDLEWQLREVLEDNDLYQKENEELKDYHLHTLKTQQTEMSKYALNLEHKLEWYDNQLTQAKEIIKDLLSLKASISSAEDVEKRFSVRERAAEFLKKE